MSAEFNLLREFTRPIAKFNGLPISLLGLPAFSKYSRKTLQNAFTKLKHKEYIACEGRHLVITKKGKKYLRQRSALLQVFNPTSTSKKVQKNFLVIFDIPEQRKAEREWLRVHLLKFGFEMIQRSVWIGPPSLPQAFCAYLKKINLDENIRFFTVELAKF